MRAASSCARAVLLAGILPAAAAHAAVASACAFCAVDTGGHAQTFDLSSLSQKTFELGGVSLCVQKALSAADNTCFVPVSAAGCKARGALD